MCKFFFNTGLSDVNKLRENLLAMCYYSHLANWLDMTIKELFDWIRAINKSANKKKG